ncbi:UNVERIFIED_CONTAM: hypothetical protein Sradi_7119700 [Sesamum radiatum]|uniref:Uncharacterized protein n=1 Tax=Sesamum radiatum TaxID=300843 RepID=A0AAW2J1W1_SESRA
MIAHLQDVKNGKSLVWVFLSWFDDVKDWLKHFQQLHEEGKSYSIIILHRPYYAGTGEAKPLPFYHQWRSLQKPLTGQKDEEQELARHLCFVNKIPFPAQRPRLVYTSLVIEPMDEDSDSDSIPEPDSQDPWNYGTEINLERHSKMNTRSRARNGNGGIGDLAGIFEHVPQGEVQQPLGHRREEDSGRPGEQEEQERAPPRSRKSKSELTPRSGKSKGELTPRSGKEQERAPPPPMIQLTPEALRQMIEDTSAQAASRAVAQYVAEHALPPQPPRQSGRGRGAGSAPENNECGRAGQQARDQLEEEWRADLPYRKMSCLLYPGSTP